MKVLYSKSYLIYLAIMALAVGYGSDFANENSIFEKILAIFIILLLIISVLYFLGKRNRLNNKLVLQNNILFFLFTITVIIIHFLFHDFDLEWKFYIQIILSIIIFIILPSIIIVNGDLFVYWIKVVSFISLIIAVTSILGTLGLDSIIGISLRNKEFYGTLSGITASGGIMEHTAAAGMQLGVGIFCTYYLYKRYNLAFYRIGLLVISLGFIVCQSRGALLGLIVAVCIILLPKKFRNNKPLLITTTVGLFIMPFIAISIIKIIPILAGYLRLEQGFGPRFALWLYSIPHILDSPFIGHGFNSVSSFTLSYSAILKDVADFRASGASFHNIFMNIAYDWGLCAVVIYISIHIAILWKLGGEYRYNVLERKLLLSIAILLIIQNNFTTFSLGGIRSISISGAIFLGLANIFPAVRFRNII